MNQNNAGGGGNAGGIDPYTAGTLAILTDTARAGRGGWGGSGGGWGGGGEGGGGFGGLFAGPSSNAVRINRNNEALHDISRHQDTNRVCDRLTDGFQGSMQSGFASELRVSDKLGAMEREINQNAREAAKCCCALQLQQSENTKDIQRQISEMEGRLALQQCKDNGLVIAEIKSVESRAVERDLADAKSEITALKIQNACGCGCSPCNGHGHGRGRGGGGKGE